MKKVLFVVLMVVAGLQLGAQSHRDSVINQARYLKSIFRTDDAIELLSTLVEPEKMDEGVLAELADCHFQSGANDNAAGTYFILSSLAPNNVLYKIRLMQAYYRLHNHYPLLHL